MSGLIAFVALILAVMKDTGIPGWRNKSRKPGGPSGRGDPEHTGGKVSDEGSWPNIEQLERAVVLAASHRPGCPGYQVNCSCGDEALAALRTSVPQVSRAVTEGSWFRIVADMKVCPKCWAPIVIISDRTAGTGTYDYDGRAEHVCPPVGNAVDPQPFERDHS